MQKKITNLAATGLIVLSTALITAPAFADTSSQTSGSSGTSFREHKNGFGKFGGKMMGHPFSGKNGVFGTVTSVSGNIITINNAQGTSYTIDATNAKFPAGMFGNSPESISSIQVGDKISARGTINGTSVVANMISDQTFLSRTMFEGKVTAVNGNSITIENRNKNTYTIDATSAKLAKGVGKDQTTISVSDVAVGDHIVAVGTLNGTNVTATDIKDMKTGPFAGQGVKGLKQKKN